MKVCFLTPNFPPEVHAGTEMAVSALGAAMQRRGVEVVVVTSSEQVHDGREPDLVPEQYGGMRVLRLKKRADEWDQSKLHRPRLVALVDSVLETERPDVVHSHSMGVFGAGHAAAARRRRVPMVMTIHDLFVTCPRYFRLPPQADIVCPTDADRTVCVRCVNLTLQQSDLAIVRQIVDGRAAAIAEEAAQIAVLTAPSRTAASIVERCMPSPRPVEVVPHGLLDPSAAAVRAPRPAAGERVRVGTFGNLVEQKGVLELVRAVAGADCELHLAGSYFDAAFAQRVRSLADELGVSLVYHGPYGPGAAHPALQLHLAVFPSKCAETYGLVVDEALARGVPTVVSDFGALAERADTGGVVVSTLSSLRAVVHDLVRDRERLLRLAAAVPAALPTVDVAAARYIELYERARHAE